MAYQAVVSSWQPKQSGQIWLEFTSTHTSKEVRGKIEKLQIRISGSTEYVDKDFKIQANQLTDRTFRIDLDPQETRKYGVITDIVETLSYRITCRDSTGYEVVVEGDRAGLESTELQQEDEEELSEAEEGQIVRLKSTPHRRIGGILRVEPEDGKPNDFGIFNKHDINPTAAYIDLGRDGFRQLAGKFTAYLDWDRDTVASPPDDLVAVHIRNIESGEHGWVFRSDILCRKK